MDNLNAEKVFVEKGELLAALYDADAITMKGVKIINQFPAADVAKVPHGRWNIDGSCSECHGYDNRDPYGSAFCPHCGAKMDLEE